MEMSRKDQKWKVKMEGRSDWLDFSSIQLVFTQKEVVLAPAVAAEGDDQTAGEQHQDG